MNARKGKHYFNIYKYISQLKKIIPLSWKCYASVYCKNDRIFHFKTNGSLGRREHAHHALRSVKDTFPQGIYDYGNRFILFFIALQKDLTIK